MKRIVILILMLASMRLTAQTLCKSTCKQDDYHLYYTVCVEKDTFQLTDYKYVYTYDRRVKSVNKVFKFGKTKFYIKADVNSFSGCCTSDFGVPSFRFILKMRDIYYIVLVDNYIITKVIPVPNKQPYPVPNGVS